jgi:hypothetical protein
VHGGRVRSFAPGVVRGEVIDAARPASPSGFPVSEGSAASEPSAPIANTAIELVALTSAYRNRLSFDTPTSVGLPPVTAVTPSAFSSAADPSWPIRKPEMFPVPALVTYP